MTGARHRSRAVAWFVAFALAAIALHWAGTGPLPAPPMSDPGRWRSWLEARGPVVVAFSLLRVAAVAALWYLVVTTSVGALLRMAGAVSLVRLTDRLTIAPVRGMLAGSLSLGMATSGVVAVAAPMLRMPVAAAAQPAPSTTEAPPATVTMHRLGPAETPSTPAVTPGHETSTTASTARWTVKPGECFWSIAEAVLTERSGRPASDAEIVPYWHRLIEANRHELAHETDPDLIFPGQGFVVPGP